MVVAAARAVAVAAVDEDEEGTADPFELSCADADSTSSAASVCSMDDRLPVVPMLVVLGERRCCTSLGASARTIGLLPLLLRLFLRRRAWIGTGDTDLRSPASCASRDSVVGVVSLVSDTDILLIGGPDTLRFLLSAAALAFVRTELVAATVVVVVVVGGDGDRC